MTMSSTPDEDDDVDGDVDDNDDNDDDENDTKLLMMVISALLILQHHYDIYLSKTVTGKVFLLVRYDNNDGDELLVLSDLCVRPNPCNMEFDSRKTLLHGLKLLYLPRLSLSKRIMDRFWKLRSIILKLVRMRIPDENRVTYNPL